MFQAATVNTDSAANPVAPGEALDEQYQALLECIGEEPTQIDTMMERSGLTANAVSSMLLILELRGYVSSTAGGGFARTSKRLTE